MKYLQVKQFLLRFCFRFWNDATFKLFKTLFLNTYLAVKNAPNWFKWFGKFSFFPVCKDFCHWTKRLYMRNWFFYLLTHNTCLLFVFWWLFNMVWNKTCIEKDSRYLVKLTKSQKVLSIGSHLPKKYTRSLFYLKAKVEDIDFVHCFEDGTEIKIYFTIRFSHL